MTNQEEDKFIHGLLELGQKSTNGFDVGTAGISALGFKASDINTLINRLQSEGLAQVDFGNYILLTAKGMSIARTPGGYHAHQLLQSQKARLANIKEWFGAWGSIIGGIAGVLSFFVSLATLWFSLNDAKSKEENYLSLSRRIDRLEQSQKATIKSLQAHIQHERERSIEVTHSQTRILLEAQKSSQ